VKLHTQHQTVSKFHTASPLLFKKKSSSSTPPTTAASSSSTSRAPNASTSDSEHTIDTTPDTTSRKEIEILRDLSEAQRKIVLHGDGPMLLLAGPGTGKSHVIIARIAQLITQAAPSVAPAADPADRADPATPVHSSDTDRVVPSALLVLTFAEKGAHDMQSRLDLHLPMGESDVTLRTFHSFASDILQEYGYLIGLSANFRVLVSAQQALFLRDHLHEFELEHCRPAGDSSSVVWALRELFGTIQDSGIGPTEYMKYAQKLYDIIHTHGNDVKYSHLAMSLKEADIQLPKSIRTVAAARHHAMLQVELASAYDRYQQLKIEHDVLDFHDLLSLAVKVMREHPSAAEEIGSRFSHILVDEYQDVNVAISQLIDALVTASPHRNLLVVGDDDQAIFAFRGAGAHNFHHFAGQYPDAAVFCLGDSMRSYRSVLDAAQRLIEHNPNRLENQLQISKKLVGIPEPVEAKFQGPRVNHLPFHNAHSEVVGIVESIKKLQEHKAIQSLSEVAVLVRQNWDIPRTLHGFAEHGMPVVVSSGTKLFAQTEVKLIMNLLATVVRPLDNLVLYQLLSSPLYAFPSRHLSKLQAEATAGRVSLRELLEYLVCPDFDSAKSSRIGASDAPDETDGLPHVRVSKLIAERSTLDHIRSSFSANVIALIERIVRDLHRYEDLSVTSGIRHVVATFVDESKLLSYFAADAGVAEEKGRNITSLLRYMEQQEEAAGTDRTAFVLPLLEDLRGLGDDPDIEEGDVVEGVQVMTIHRAKGLEFTAVYLMACTEEKIPGRHRGPRLPLPSELLKAPEATREMHEAEERRLVYVALTRARSHFFFTHADFYSPKRKQKPSRFIREALGAVSASQPQSVPTTPAANSVIDATSMSQIPAEQRSMEDDKALAVMTGPLRLSYSRLDIFRRCPLRYYFNYVMELPSSKSPPLVLGSALHAGIAAYGDHVIEGKAISEDDLVAAFAQEWDESVYPNERKAKQEYEGGLTSLRAFVQRFTQHDSKPISVEQKFDVSIVDPTVPDAGVTSAESETAAVTAAADTPTIRMIGYWDRIDEFEEKQPEPEVTAQSTDDGKSVVIREFKTKLHPFQRKTITDNLQLKVYAWAYYKVHQRLPALTQLESIQSGEVLEYIPKPEDCDEVEQVIIDTASKIRAGDFRATPSYLDCLLCPFSDVCDDAATKKNI
jgi:ATP-dependent DNA helicase UvrD/PcrA